MMVDQEILTAVRRPVDEARGLPNACYTSPEVFAAERARVFFRHWAAIGFAGEVAQPGEVRPVDFLGQPLLIVRDRAGTLRVFYNVCRHRGMVLVAEAGRLPRTIRCPYHSWCYELDGRLRTTPHVGGPGINRHDAIRRDELGLIEVPSAEWFGVVFVNLDGAAAPFDEWAAPARERWRDFEQPLHFDPASCFELELAANWKLAVENYCESYHLPWVHPGLNSYSRLEDHYNIEAPGHFSGQGTRAYRPMLATDGRRFPAFAELGPKWDEGAEYIALYPNVLLGVHRDHSFAIVIDPLGPGRTRERVAIFYADATALSAEFAVLRARNREMWREVFVEDVFVVEGMQKGRGAAGFDGGRFSPVMDAPTHCFHAWVADALAG